MLDLWYISIQSLMKEFLALNLTHLGRLVHDEQKKKNCKNKEGADSKGVPSLFLSA